MDYEKKYKDALAWMREVYPTLTGAAKEDAMHYFPELRESEDERMMREFNDWLCEEIECRTNDLRDEKDRRTLNMLCFVLTKVKEWLEKQKEQKPNIEICPHSIKSKSYSVNPITPEMMGKAADQCTWSQCDDNRFWIIDRAKKDILAKTNIESSPEEMKVLDSFLFRCWKMGWLGKYDVIVPEQKPVDGEKYPESKTFEDEWKDFYNNHLINRQVMSKREIAKHFFWFGQKQIEKPVEWSEEDEEPEYYQHFDPDC